MKMMYIQAKINNRDLGLILLRIVEMKSVCDTNVIVNNSNRREPIVKVYYFACWQLPLCLCSLLSREQPNIVKHNNNQHRNNDIGTNSADIENIDNMGDKRKQ